MSRLGRKIAGGLIVGMMVMGMLSLNAGRVWAHSRTSVSTTAVVDVLVTPIVTASLIASPTFYDFGLLELNSSSYSASAINLDNNGNIGVTLQKHGADTLSGDWTIAVTSGVNTFRLYAATATTPPAALSEFDDTDRMNDNTTLTDLDAVGSGATQAVITSTESVDVWFRIDMPSATTVSAQQTISVHFVGTAQ